MTFAQDVGNFAEERAAEYLISLNWLILGRNVKNEFGELDITAIDTGKKNRTRSRELVIVEVRARTLGKIQSPLESIGTRKLQTLIKSARLFIEENEWDGFWRIDVIGITFHNKIKQLKNNKDWNLEHVRDITCGMNIFS